jgi:hypothetical protein
MSTIREPGRDLRVIKDADVVVLGGGPGGWTAAVSAAREGARTVLVERYGFLGGMGTEANVNQWSLRVMASGIREPSPVVAGIAREVVDRMVLENGLFEPDDVWQMGLYTEIRWRTMFPYDPEVLKWISLEMVQEAGVDLLLHTTVSDVVKDRDKLSHVIVQNKGGRAAIGGKVFIDATGDADILAWGGGAFEVEEERLGGTIIFWLGNVDLDKAAEYQDLTKMGTLLRQAIDNGDLDWGADLFYSPTVSYAADQPFGFGFGMCHVPADYPHRYNRQSEIRVWAAHVRNPDVLSFEGMTRAEVEGRRKVRSIAHFMANYVPGFEHSYVVSSGAQIGIRETRRSIGDYVLTADDIRTGTQFPDVIGRGVQEEFVHGYGTDPVFCPPHDIPYRSLLPQGPRNLLMSGRCISLSGHAAKLHSPRTQETCMVVGQAAGAAAALAAASDGDPRGVDVAVLQQRLVAHGANLGDLLARADLPISGRPSDAGVALEPDVVARPSALTLSGHEAQSAKR